MSCHGGTHFSCECQRDLLEDALDSLSTMVTGLERFLEANPKMRNKIYSEFFIGLPSAKSVVNRTREKRRF
jgi:hypothetical protein